MPQYLSDKEYRHNDHNMKLIKALYLSVFGLAALDNAAPLVINTAMDLKRDAGALPKIFSGPLPVAEPAKRDPEAAPEPMPEPLPQVFPPAKRDAEAAPEPMPEPLLQMFLPAKRDADALPEPYSEAISEPQRPARK